MHLNSFLKLDNGLVQISEIASIDDTKLESDYSIEIRTKQNQVFVATELNAIEVIMQIRPSALEGKRLKWAKRVWYVHNLIGHPIMQVLAMFKCYKLAMWVHDVTVPKPTGFKKRS